MNLDVHPHAVAGGENQSVLDEWLEARAKAEVNAATEKSADKYLGLLISHLLAHAHARTKVEGNECSWMLSVGMATIWNGLEAFRDEVLWTIKVFFATVDYLRDIVDVPTLVNLETAGENVIFNRCVAINRNWRLETVLLLVTNTFPSSGLPESLLEDTFKVFQSLQVLVSQRSLANLSLQLLSNFSQDTLHFNLRNNKGLMRGRTGFLAK